MKSKTILGADGATKMQQITVGTHGKGGEAGINGFARSKAVYYTFLRLLGTPAVNADDEEKERREMYRVTLFHKGDFEAQLDKTKEVLKAAGVYINSIDAESYETETGYWLVPITVEILKEE